MTMGERRDGFKAGELALAIEWLCSLGIDGRGVGMHVHGGQRRD
jgi:hypothetical protein